jgi:hypothetical protein
MHIFQYSKTDYSRDYISFNIVRRIIEGGYIFFSIVRRIINLVGGYKLQVQCSTKRRYCVTNMSRQK